MKKEKNFMIVDSVKYVKNVESILNTRKIKFERLAPTRYYIWATERAVVKLLDDCEYVAITLCD